MLKKVLITAAGGMVALSLSACGGSPEATKDKSEKTNKDIVVSKSDESPKKESSVKDDENVEPTQLIPSSQNDQLKDYVMSVDSPSVEFQEQEIKIIGIDFGKKGIPSILGIKDVSGEYIGSFSVLKGMNSDGKRDAELILFLEFHSKKEIDPRSGITPTIPDISVTDDRGDTAKEIAAVPNAATETYYRKEGNIIAAVGFAVYSNAKSFTIKLNGNTFLVNNLNYRTEEEF
ncbi:hypothetical protein SporoP37_00195 [Sporosarcina sp. P37]|uniref:hypothetical protein n=1 Tax=unclassified Sporosarcina TaxID=2647733 RepID=UPI000A17B86C|nr:MULTISPECIES: hypothetical protein [unclassified Sporosarcina]ARK23261.1 hypothetical protein SporoP37_00195 [Sporosarcina sp. P37]PID19512.1 hypothetical protein CSV62_03145 [Sporosarcina sp. P35]